MIMSFTNHARRVRDTTLPFADRVCALRSCVSLYKPFGFLATLSHLRTHAGDFERDEDALLRALAAVEASRRAWHAEIERYAALRRAEKRRGARVPADSGPYRPTRWYG